MPPRTKFAGGLAALVGSDSEPDFDDASVLPSTTSGPSHAMGAVKRGRGRPPAANRVTKPAQKSKTNVGGALATARQALTDKGTPNARQKAKKSGKEVEADDDIHTADQQEISGQAPSNVQPAKRATAVARGKSANTAPSAKQRRSPVKNSASSPREIPETQDFNAMDVDHDLELADGLDVNTTAAHDGVARSQAFDQDSSDVSVRRRLGELTRKYASLEARHRDLQEVGVKEAERNYERLRRQAEESTTASNKLIAQLKVEVAAQTALANEGAQLRQQLEHSETEIGSLQDTIADLNQSLAEARSEGKTLSNKLVAARNAEASMKVPGSAMKAGAPNGRSAPSEVVQVAQAKEDLYGDLTGLIVRGLRRGAQEDVFDCIQTGRNGTLHFKLAVESVEAANSYKDVQFTYRPQLDDDRDGDVMDALPDYLVEEITFVRAQAAKFYSRVNKCLTERPARPVVTEENTAQ